MRSTLRPRARAAADPRVWGARCLLFFLPLVLGLAWADRQVAQNGELGFPMDDPYIHFQFARNLATGHGFAFNPGEPTPGATSPLWVVVLALGRTLGAPIEPLALGLGVLLAGVVAVLTLEVGLAAGLPLALSACAGIAVGACGRLIWASLSGMEITLATALFLLVVRAQQSKREGLPRALLLGGLAGLAATARPEMAMLGPLVVVIEALRLARNEPARGAFTPLLPLAAAFALALLPYAVFCFATTGRLLPNTYYAKGVIGRASDPHLAHYRATYLPLAFQFAYHDNLSFAVLLVPGIVAWLARRARRDAALLAAWPLAFWAYSWVVFPRHFSVSRYSIPLIPALALVSMEPLAWLLERLRGAVARRVTLAAVGLAVVIGAAKSLGDYQPIYLSNVDNIVRMQVRMGRWVARHVPLGARIATNDVGAITYYGGRYCIDTVGLVSSGLVTHLLSWWKQHGSVNAELALPSYFRQSRPDYCILFPAWYPNLTRAPWLRYVGEFDYPNTTGGGDQLVVYRVIGTPAGPADAMR